MRVYSSVGVAGFLFLSFACSSFAVTRYVNVSNATPAAPFTNWGMASTAIQPAIDEAVSGDEILVFNIDVEPVTGGGRRSVQFKREFFSD